MFMLYADQPDRRARTAALDVAVLAWIAAWVVIGIVTARLVLTLQEVADGVAGAGRTIDQVIEALKAAVPSGFPVIGPAFHQLATSLEGVSGHQLIAWGTQAHDDIAKLAAALALLLALPPILIVGGRHVRRRYKQARELGAAADFVSAARRSGSEAAAAAVLAHRAVATLSFRDLMRTSADPAADLRSQRHEALASALLNSLGLAPERLTGRTG